MAKDRFGFDFTGREGRHFMRRPALSRRMLFRHAASAVTGYMLLPTGPSQIVARGAVTPINTAKYCVFVNMTGAPSHSDLFDLKTGPWTPATFQAAGSGEVQWAHGLMPRIGEQLSSVALLRSVRAWTGVHSLGQTWVQIGRNPVQAQSKFAPHIGSVASIELKRADKVLPAFLALNTGDMPGSGYLAPEHGPFAVAPNGGGLPGSIHQDGPAAFNRRYAILEQLDSAERNTVSLGAPSAEAAAWNAAARRLMYNDAVNQAFSSTADERTRYGNSNFGSAMITARNLIKSDLGPRFIQVNIGGWDNHANIYNTLNAANAASLGRQFDSGLGSLIADLRAANLLDQTLIVAMGEFGRTVGNLNSTAGRDHFLQQAVFMAGAGIKGPVGIGTTDATAAVTTNPGWSRDRDIRVEDIEATIYSALGIDWSTIRKDDPTGRGFYYVPDSDKDTYAPLHEIWR
jgi:Protein of unknown function (DUF1501)